jgi:hypothetical protein
MQVVLVLLRSWLCVIGPLLGRGLSCKSSRAEPVAHAHPHASISRWPPYLLNLPFGSLKLGPSSLILFNEGSVHSFWDPVQPDTTQQSSPPVTSHYTRQNEDICCPVLSWASFSLRPGPGALSFSYRICGMRASWRPLVSLNLKS